MRGKSNPGEILLIIYLKTISWEGKGESSLFLIHRSVLQLELKKLPSLALCSLDAGRAERRAGLHNKQGGKRTAEEPGTVCQQCRLHRLKLERN